MSDTPRFATLDDFEALVAIDGALQADPARREALRVALAENTCHLVAAEGAVAGYAIMRPDHFFGRAFVTLVYVAAPYRRRGLAAMLIAHLETLSPSETLWISTNVSNTPMRTLLPGAGYIESGTVEGIDEGDPEIFFRKRVR